jgi:hypothetical protein
MFGGNVKKLLKQFFGIRPRANMELATDYQRVFSTPEGERVLTDLIKFSTMFDVDYTNKDLYNAAYNEGMRRVGLRVLSFINIDVDQSKNQKNHQEQDYN